MKIIFIWSNKNQPYITHELLSCMYHYLNPDLSFIVFSLLFPTCCRCCLYSSRWLFLMCLSLALELQKVMKHWKHCRLSCWSASQWDDKLFSDYSSYNVITRTDRYYIVLLLCQQHHIMNELCIQILSYRTAEGRPRAQTWSQTWSPLRWWISSHSQQWLVLSSPCPCWCFHTPPCHMEL